MTQHKKLIFPKKSVPVQNRQTGEKRLVEAPIGKLQRDQLADELSPGRTSGNQPVIMETASEPDSKMDPVKPSRKIPADRDDKNPKKKIESGDEYLESYYTGKIKSLSDETIRSIGTNVLFSFTVRARLIDDSIKADFTLDKTRQLFVLSLNAGNYTGLSRMLRDFGKDVVCRHPVMASQESETWFPGTSPSDHSNIKVLWNTFVSSTSKPASDEPNNEDPGDRKPNPADIQKARRNAFLCANIWRYAEHQISFAELLRSLRATLFESVSEGKNLEKHLLAYLVSVQEKDRSGVADFLRWSIEQTIHVQNQADHFRLRLDSLQSQQQEVDELLATKEVEIAGMNRQLAGLRAQVLAAEEEVRVLKVHSKDDLERQASRTIRALEDEIPVLTDCLTALKRDPPKVEVAKEYLGTALDTLNNELKILREK
jgi:hypothetical protein